MINLIIGIICLLIFTVNLFVRKENKLPEFVAALNLFFGIVNILSFIF